MGEYEDYIYLSEKEEKQVQSKEVLKGPVYVKRILLGILLFLYLLWYIPFAKNEVLTLIHGWEFIGRHNDWSMREDSSVTYMKVVKYYAKEEALVFYSFNNNSCAELYRFIRNKDGEWVFDEARCIWSTGSADEFYWPYIFRPGIFIYYS